MAKPEYKAVEHPCMIKLNKRTQIRDAHNQPPDFPKYTFSLTPIEKLPGYATSKERFLGNVTFCFHINLFSTVNFIFASKITIYLLLLVQMSSVKSQEFRMQQWFAQVQGSQ